MQEDDQGFIGQELSLSGFDKPRALEPLGSALVHPDGRAHAKIISRCGLSLVSGGSS